MLLHLLHVHLPVTKQDIWDIQVGTKCVASRILGVRDI